MRNRVGRLSNMTSRKTGKKGKKGELLIETIVSIAIFAVVMVAVSSMVAVAYNMLTASREQYEQIRQRCSDIETMQDVGGYTGGTVLQYQFDDAGNTRVDTAIRVYEDGQVAFFTLGK